MYPLSFWQKLFLNLSLFYKRGIAAESTRLRLLNHALVQEGKCPRCTAVQPLWQEIEPWEAAHLQATEVMAPRPYTPRPAEVPHANYPFLLTLPDSMFRTRITGGA